jgi:hypothetical protein
MADFARSAFQISSASTPLLAAIVTKPVAHRVTGEVAGRPDGSASAVHDECHGLREQPRSIVPVQRREQRRAGATHLP